MPLSYRDSSWSSDQETRRRIRVSWPQRVSTQTQILGWFGICYLFAFLYCHYASSRDPTSYFFDRHHAYEKIYSSQRIREAGAFINSAENAHNPARLSAETPHICVGVATVARRGEQYVSLTVGSLLAGLNEEERKQIYLNLLIGHTQPSKHPSSAAKWVQTLPDQVLGYQANSTDFGKIQRWEAGGLYRNKTIYDFTYLLKNCYETGARYVAMIEDDTIAIAGWFPRLLGALDVVTAQMARRPAKEQWIYLRLFYLDSLLGWNKEEWPKYLLGSIAVQWTFIGLILAIKHRFRRRFEILTTTYIYVLSFVCVPAVVGLYFLAGRQTVSPISAGVHEMNKYGCCSQGLVFPRSIIPHVLEQADLDTDWLVDMMIEKIADKGGLTRWAEVPSLLQHIGATSSKGFGFDGSAKDIWNFRFELYPPR